MATLLLPSTFESDCTPVEAKRILFKRPVNRKAALLSGFAGAADKKLAGRDNGWQDSLPPLFYY
jgi:hypothetical protein